MKCAHKANFQRQKAEGGSRNLMASRHEGNFCSNENFLNLDFSDSYKTVTSIKKKAVNCTLTVGKFYGIKVTPQYSCYFFKEYIPRKTFY